VGKVLQFPNKPECPPHSWVSIYEDDLISVVIDGVDEAEHEIAGRICTKCSLIQMRESRAPLSGSSGGRGPGFLRLWIEIYFGSQADHL